MITQEEKIKLKKNQSQHKNKTSLFHFKPHNMIFLYPMHHKQNEQLKVTIKIKLAIHLTQDEQKSSPLSHRLFLAPL